MSSRASPQTSPRKGKYLQCRVYMLDDVWQVFQVPIKALGQALFAEVVRKLQLLEMDYFDLEFTDRINSNGTPCWLDHEKPVLKQVSNQDLSFKFLVKFYTPDPGLLEEEYTRYLFALQVRRDLATGAMPCQEHTAVLLASYVVQAEIGDFLEDEYLDHSYLSHLKLLPNQNRDLEIKIMEHHKEHIGQTPAEADFNLLDTARKVELYGIRVHSAKDHEGVPLNLAVAHMGVLVYQNYTKINTFSWAKIRKLSFKRKKFLIKLHPEGYGYYKDTVEFYFDSRNDCKNFWKKCIEHHAFFRCQQVKRLPRNRTRVVSRGSSFRYAGRTQKQLTEYVRENYIKRPPFERTMSQRTVASVNRSHATTPNTGTLNSRDIHFGGHNTSASSGSHILEMNSSSRDRLDGLGSRVETAEVHDDSSQSGSRSINSPKRDRERDFSQQQQQLQGSQEWHQQQQQYHEKDGQAPHDIKGGSDNFHYSYYQISYDGQPADQNANDNDDNLSNDQVLSQDGSLDYLSHDDNVSHDSYLCEDPKDVMVDQLETELRIDEDKLLRELAEEQRRQEEEEQLRWEKAALSVGRVDEYNRATDHGSNASVISNLSGNDGSFITNSSAFSNGAAVLVRDDGLTSHEDYANSNGEVEEISYILHRRHRSPHSVQGEPAPVLSTFKAPSPTLLEQDSERSTERSRARNSTPRSSKASTPSNARKSGGKGSSRLTRDQERAQLNKIKTNLSSPIIPANARDKSPGSRRGVDFVKFNKLPPADSYSCADDSISPSSETNPLSTLEQNYKDLDQPYKEPYREPYKETVEVQEVSHVIEIVNATPPKVSSPVKSNDEAASLKPRINLVPPKATIEDLTPTDSDSGPETLERKKKSGSAGNISKPEVAPKPTGVIMRTVSDEDVKKAEKPTALSIETQAAFRLSQQDFPFMDDDEVPPSPTEQVGIHRIVEENDEELSSTSSGYPAPPPPPILETPASETTEDLPLPLPPEELVGGDEGAVKTEDEMDFEDCEEPYEAPPIENQEVTVAPPCVEPEIVPEPPRENVYSAAPPPVIETIGPVGGTLGEPIGDVSFDSVFTASDTQDEIKKKSTSTLDSQDIFAAKAEEELSAADMETCDDDFSDGKRSGPGSYLGDDDLSLSDYMPSPKHLKVGGEPIEISSESDVELPTEVDIPDHIDFEKRFEMKMESESVLEDLPPPPPLKESYRESRRVVDSSRDIPPPDISALDEFEKQFEQTLEDEGIQLLAETDDMDKEMRNDSLSSSSASDIEGKGWSLPPPPPPPVPPPKGDISSEDEVMHPDSDDLGDPLAVLNASASNRPYAPMGFHYEPPEIEEDSDSDLPPPPPPPPEDYHCQGGVANVPSPGGKTGYDDDDDDDGHDAGSESSSDDGNCEVGLDDSADMLESLEQLKELEERLSSSEDEAEGHPRGHPGGHPVGYPPSGLTSFSIGKSHNQQQQQRKQSSSSSSSSDFEEIPASIRQRQALLAAQNFQVGGQTQHQRGQIHRNPYAEDFPPPPPPPPGD